MFADRKAGEISKRGLTMVCGTALSHVVTFLLRGSFAENGNGFAVSQLISRRRHLKIKSYHAFGDVNPLGMKFHMVVIMADGIG